MFTQGKVLARRRQVAGLWLRGMSPMRIAANLGVSRSTIERDIVVIRDEVAQESRVPLDVKAARSVATLRLVQSEAWTVFMRLDDKSSSKIGALNTIANTEATIARIEGTLSGEYVMQQTINVIGGAEWQMLRGLVLQALEPHPDARRDVVEALASAQVQAQAQAQQPAEEGGETDDDDDDDDIESDDDTVDG